MSRGGIDEAPRGSVSGASGDAGVEYRRGVAAYAVALGLAGVALRADWIPQARAEVAAVSLETDDPVDDIRIDFGSGWCALLQAKSTLTAGRPLREAVAQWVKAARAGLEPGKDRLVIVAGRLSGSMRALQAVLERERSELPGSRTKAETAALQQVQGLLHELSEEEQHTVLQCAAIWKLEVQEPTSSDVQVAVGQLRHAVAEQDHAAAERVWAKLVAVAGRVARLRGGYTIAGWRDLLSGMVRVPGASSANGAGRVRTTPDPGNVLPLAGSVNDRAVLGIHPAIPLSAGHDRGLSAELPSYISRDFDAELHAALHEGAARGGFVLLVGPAAAGKTRSAYEGVRQVLPDWNFVIPGAGFHADLTQVRSVPGHSVVWLDEVASLLDSGELTSRTVRGLLAGAQGPVVLIGTIWPADYERLTMPGNDERLRRNARETLQMARHFSVAAEFSTTERARSQEVARFDPRVAEAVARHRDGPVPAVLAGSPELILRWTQPGNPLGAAVITAATDAVLCGHPSGIPAALLSVLAEKYLTSTQRASAGADWFDSALEWACQPVRSGIAPLTPHRTRVTGGVDEHTNDEYYVSDILVHHARLLYQASRRVPVVPWDDLVARVDHAACIRIGHYALAYGLPHTGERALTRPAQAGHSEALAPLGLALADQGKLEEARFWYERAAEAGEPDTVTMVAVILEQQGDRAGAKRWLQRAIDEENDPAAMYGLGQTFEAEGKSDDAAYWYRRAADTGADHGAGMCCLGTLFARQGDVDAAVACFEQAADAGNVPAMLNLGVHLRGARATEGAVARFRQAADRGAVEGAAHLGDLLRELGDFDGARLWLGRAAAVGHVTSMVSLGVVLRQAGEGEHARPWLQRAAEAGDPEGMGAFGSLLDDQGDSQGAKTWLGRAADAGEPISMALYALLLIDEGQVSSARQWADKAKAAGTPLPQEVLQHLDRHDDSGHARRCTHLDVPNDGVSGATHWTPIEHECSCVINWGWQPTVLDPRSFMTWCLIAADRNCPWHDPRVQEAVSGIDTPIVDLALPTTGDFVCIQKATDDDIQLGRRLGHRLRALVRKIDRNDPAQFMSEIPESARNWMHDCGLDPVEAWFDAQLADIVLNRGEPLNRELISNMGTDP